MKKVLILAYDFPPYVSVGGLRPYNWYRYFKEFGVEPIVVTRQWSNVFGNHLDYIAPSKSDGTVFEQSEFGTVLRSPYRPNKANRMMIKYGEEKYRTFRRSISAYYELAQFHFKIGPKIEIYHAARHYLKNNKVDAIIATGDPFILFKYAADLSKEFNTPWIADYRDPWSHNDDRSINSLLRYYMRRKEQRFTKSATCITTVSTFFQQTIARLLPNHQFIVLPNGYDPEVVDTVSDIAQNNQKLTIGFVGTIYEYHPLELFMSVVADFLEKEPNAQMQINFYGTNVPEQIQVLVQSKFPVLQHHVKIHPKMPNLELMKVLATNSVMLLFNYYSIIGTKIYDYIGIQRKIILCFTEDKEAQALKEKHYKVNELEGESKQLQADLIQQTNSGIAIRDREHLAKVLEELYAEFSMNRSIACHTIDVEKFSRKIQVEQLAKYILNL